MKYQLIVKDMTAMQFMTSVLALPEIFEKFKDLDIISVFNTDNNVIEVTVLVADTIDVESFEEQLTQAVFSPDSNIIEWKKL